jgi:hypothetical protein
MNNKNLTRFVESCMIGKGYIKEATTQELQESLTKQSTRITESVNSESGGWWVPISFYNKLNGNNRNYNRKLWENVINNQRDIYAGSSMLLDHPQGDSDGSPRDICGVWLDAKLDPSDRNGVGLVYGLLVPCGRNGEDLKDCLKKGLRIGTSSSGFGQLMSDGVTVDPDSYQIERLADWVLNPSQQTFFSYDEGCNSIEDRSIREANEEKTYNTMNENTIKEKTMKDPKIARLEEKKFRRDMESFLESANNIRDPQERLEEFKEIKSYLEDGACPDLREKIEKKIAEEEKAIKNALQDSITFKEKFGISSAEDLAEKLTRLTEDTKVIESESQQWKSISEKLQEKYSETKKALEEQKKALDARPTNEFVEALKDSNAKLNEKLTTQNKKAYEVVSKLTEACKDLQKENTSLKEENTSLKESLEARPTNEEVTSLKEANTKLTEDVEAKAAKIQESEAQINTLTEKCSILETLQNEKVSLEEKVALSKKADEMNEKSYLALQEAYNKLVEENKKLTENSKKANILNQRAQIELQEACKDLTEKNKELEALVESTKKEAEEKEVLEEKKVERTPMKTPVELYYEHLSNRYGKEVAPLKRRILESTDVAEAKRIFNSKFFEDGPMRESRKPEIRRATPIVEKKEEAHVSKAPDSVDRMPEGWV